ncbi:MAG: hypothetical protein AB7G93_06380 [Bdellovibrionales bacterium]
MKRVLICLVISLSVIPATAEIDRVITGNASIEGCQGGGGRAVNGSKFGYYLLCDGGRFHGYIIYANRPLTLNNYPETNFRCTASAFRRCEYTGVGTILNCEPYDGPKVNVYDVFLTKADLAPSLTVRLPGWHDRSSFLADPVSGGTSRAIVWKRNGENMGNVEIDITNWAGTNSHGWIEGIRAGDSDQSHGGGFEGSDGTLGRRVYSFSSVMLLKNNDISEDGTSIRVSEGRLTGTFQIDITERRLNSENPIFKTEVYTCTNNSDHP